MSTYANKNTVPLPLTSPVSSWNTSVISAYQRLGMPVSRHTSVSANQPPAEARTLVCSHQCTFISSVFHGLLNRLDRFSSSESRIMPQQWTTEETIVLVYFRSREVLPRVVNSLIHLKGGTLRTKPMLLVQKLGRLLAEEQDAGRPAMYNKTTKTWDLQVTDQWLVSTIICRAEIMARTELGDKKRAPLYYEKLKALTDFGPREKAVVGDVGLERIQTTCSPCVDNSPQIQSLDPIMAKLAWNVELPVSPAIETEADQDLPISP